MPEPKTIEETLKQAEKYATQELDPAMDMLKKTVAEGLSRIVEQVKPEHDEIKGWLGELAHDTNYTAELTGYRSLIDRIDRIIIPFTSELHSDEKPAYIADMLDNEGLSALIQTQADIQSDMSVITNAYNDNFFDMLSSVSSRIKKIPDHEREPYDCYNFLIRIANDFVTLDERAKIIKKADLKYAQKQSILPEGMIEELRSKAKQGFNDLFQYIADDIAAMQKKADEEGQRPDNDLLSDYLQIIESTDKNSALNRIDPDLAKKLSGVESTIETLMEYGREERGFSRGVSGHLRDEQKILALYDGNNRMYVVCPAFMQDVVEESAEYSAGKCREFPYKGDFLDLQLMLIMMGERGNRRYSKIKANLIERGIKINEFIGLDVLSMFDNCRVTDYGKEFLPDRLRKVFGDAPFDGKTQAAGGYITDKVVLLHKEDIGYSSERAPVYSIFHESLHERVGGTMYDNAYSSLRASDIFIGGPEEIIVARKNIALKFQLHEVDYLRYCLANDVPDDITIKERDYTSELDSDEGKRELKDIIKGELMSAQPEAKQRAISDGRAVLVYHPRNTYFSLISKKGAVDFSETLPPDTYLFLDGTGVIREETKDIIDLSKFQIRHGNLTERIEQAVQCLTDKCIEIVQEKGRWAKDFWNFPWLGNNDRKRIDSLVEEHLIEEHDSNENIAQLDRSKKVVMLKYPDASDLVILAGVEAARKIYDLSIDIMTHLDETVIDLEVNGQEIFAVQYEPLLGNLDDDYSRFIERIRHNGYDVLQLLDDWNYNLSDFPDESDLDHLEEIARLEFIDDPDYPGLRTSYEPKRKIILVSNPESMYAQMFFSGYYYETIIDIMGEAAPGYEEDLSEFIAEAKDWMKAVELEFDDYVSEEKSNSLAKMLRENGFFVAERKGDLGMLEDELSPSQETCRKWKDIIMEEYAIPLEK